jgi:hypothetical protein
MIAAERRVELLARPDAGETIGRLTAAVGATPKDELRGLADVLDVRQKVDEAIDEHEGDVVWLQQQIERAHATIAAREAEAAA